MTGRFITFEGVEGCGKTTQTALLRERLERQGHTVEVTREPGGTPIGEAVRRVLLEPSHACMNPITELLLYEAARAQHVAERIQPALAAGTVVLCDRFADSTTAYQGAGRALPMEMVLRLHEQACQGTWPDLTIVIDVPAEEGLARVAREDVPDRLEREPVAFHRRVREAFLRLAEREPARVKVVDGMQTIDRVATAIYKHVEALLRTP